MGPYMDPTVGRGRRGVLLALGGSPRTACGEGTLDMVRAGRSLARRVVDDALAGGNGTPRRFRRGHGLLWKRRWDDAIQHTAEVANGGAGVLCIANDVLCEYYVRCAEYYERSIVHCERCTVYCRCVSYGFGPALRCTDPASRRLGPQIWGKKLGGGTE